MSKIRLRGIGTFETLTAASTAWAEAIAPTLASVEPSESPEEAATRIEAHQWSMGGQAPRNTEEEQWRDFLRVALARHIARLRQPGTSIRGAIRAAIAQRDDHALTVLAKVIATREGKPSRWESVRSQISRYLKGNRADGRSASLPLPMVEIILDYLRLEVRPAAP